MKPFGTLLVRVVLWPLLLLMLFPIAWMVLTSIKPEEIGEILPPVWIFKPTLSNYVAVLSGNTYASQHFGILLVHSAIVTIAATVLALAVGIPAAYGLARVPFRGRRQTAMWILSTIMFPPAVSVVPVFILAARFGLTDTYPVLVVPYAAFSLPMVIWMLRSSVKQIPYEIEEAAMIDGLSQLGVLRIIVLPLLAPGIIAAGLLCAMLSWNEFLFALTMTRANVQTAPVGLNEFTSMYGTQWGELTAAATATVAPILIVTLILRRRLIEGLTFGAVK
jgi:multiple sugar transport system permease protein/sorbitol/mannitol transport system permease protein